MGKDNWNIEKAMTNIMQQNQEKLLFKDDFKFTASEINHQILSECFLKIALIIQDDGDYYLPLFERLKDELENHRHLDSLKKLAMELSKQSLYFE